MSAEMEKLFATCPVTTCGNLVGDPREVCASCVADFGPYLQSASTAQTAGEFAVAVAESDARVAEVLAARRDLVGLSAPAVLPAGEWRASQICWCCEERRKCHRDPDHRDHWICKTCEAIQ